MISDWMKEKLIGLCKEHAVKRGEFKLSAGGTSDYFIDASKVTLLADGLWLISHFVWQIEELSTNTAYVGVMSGADPIIGALLYLASSEGYHDMKGGLMRKEADLIEGCELTDKDLVVVIDDVVTTGTQALRACAEVERLGAKVLGVAAVVDRMAGGAENIGSKGYRYFPLLTIKDLGIIGDGRV